MKYLFVVNSTHGHVFPAVKLALLLQSQGHDVLFVAAQAYEVTLGLYGINCVSVTNSPHRFLSTVDWYNVDVISDQVRVLDQVVCSYEPDRLVVGPLVMSAFIVSERYGIPPIVIGYCEYLYPDLETDSSLSRKKWRIDALTGYYNQARAKLGLPGVAADPRCSPLIGQRYLQRSTPDFDDHQKLPEQVCYVGALYWEPNYYNQKLDAFVATSKAVERPLWYVQMGRLFEYPDKWQRLMEALKDIPVNFVVDIGRADYLRGPFHSPENMSLHTFVPVGYLQDEIQGIICSGQTTSVVSAIRHEKPVLSLPHSDDAKELTRRLESKKIGLGIYEDGEIHRKNIETCMHTLLEGQFSDHLEIYYRQFADAEEHLAEALI